MSEAAIAEVCGEIQWVCEHRQPSGPTPRWHWYLNGDMKPAACGHKPIPGMPLVFKPTDKQPVPVDQQAFTILCGTCVTKAYDDASAKLDVKLSDQTWPRPIHVTERLPEMGSTVMWWTGNEWEFGKLCVFDNDCERFGWKNGELYVDPYDDMSCLQLKEGKITHWLPLPPPPTE